LLQEIKQIKEFKRPSTSRIQTAVPAERDVNLINNQVWENQVSAGILEFFQDGNQEIKFCGASAQPSRFFANELLASNPPRRRVDLKNRANELKDAKNARRHRGIASHNMRATAH